ncbi:MAG: sigma-70 family RNA polymerase sigma factor [Planctomycetes bacterium]|nr:sigma-70 family RNA polymerase sigma factor [Planctomycetota bacterium]
MPDKLEQLGAQFLAQRHVLMAFISGLIRDPNAAEDILQEVWMRLSEASRSGVPIDDLGRWCRGTARNLVLHHWREKRTARVIPDSSMLDLIERAFDEQAGAQGIWMARKNALLECLRTLPDKSRQLLAHVYESGLPLAEVAKQTGQSYAAVMMLLSRVRKGLRECVVRRVQAEERAV